jgi:hypothetical protein
MSAEPGHVDPLIDDDDDRKNDFLTIVLLARRLQDAVYNEVFFKELARVNRNRRQENSPQMDGLSLSMLGSGGIVPRDASAEECRWEPNEFNCLDLPDRTVGKNAKLWTDPVGFCTYEGVRTIAEQGDARGYDKELVDAARVAARYNRCVFDFCVSGFSEFTTERLKDIQRVGGTFPGVEIFMIEHNTFRRVSISRLFSLASNYQPRNREAHIPFVMVEWKNFPPKRVINNNPSVSVSNEPVEQTQQSAATFREHKEEKTTKIATPADLGLVGKKEQMKAKRDAWKGTSKK